MARLAGRPGFASTFDMPPDLMPWPLMSPESLMMPGELDEEKDDRGEGRGDRTWQFSKTKMCKFEIMGMCAKGTQCPFAHSKDELKPLPDLTCTKLCKTLIQTGSCTLRGCKYAHTKDELRATSTFHKTKLCRFSMNGHCALGSKCNFAHSMEEIRQLEADMAVLEQVEQRQLQNGFASRDGVGAIMPGYLGNANTNMQKEPASLDNRSLLAANNKKKKGKGEKGGGKGGKGVINGKGGKGNQMVRETSHQTNQMAPIDDRYAAMVAAVHPGNGVPVNGFVNQFGGMNMNETLMTHGMVSGGSMPSDWSALPGMPNVMVPIGIAAATQPGGNGLSNDRRQGRRPNNSQQLAFPTPQNSAGQGESSTQSNKRIPSPPNSRVGATTTSAPIAPEPSNLPAMRSPAYVTQTASDFVVKNTFLEFDGSFGGPLRPVRSAAGRLDQLAEQSELEGVGLDIPRVRSFPHDLHSLQEHSVFPPFRGIIDDADAAGGGPDKQFGWNQLDTSCIVDQKDDMWQVKNTFLTFSPQMKPIRSIRTAEGALCSLGDD